MKLIVDSGSTKTAWYVSFSASFGFEIATPGINPVRDDESTVLAVVRRAQQAIEAERSMGRASSFPMDGHIGEVYFYGAGCIAPYSDVVRRALSQVFPGARVEVASDLLGAARALCGRAEGIACILGTGSNSCLYDGRTIVRQTPALGWILGDEGSGAVLGRLLVGDVLKRQLPPSLCDAFFERFHLTQADLVERVYRQPQANRFLASLVPFLGEHVAEPAIAALLVAEFRRFLVRNVLAYERPDLPVSFVGGVASTYSEQLREAVEAEGLQMGVVLQNPIQRMGQYHTNG